MFIKLAIKRAIMQSCKHFYQQAIINFIQYIYYISLRDECEYLIRCNGKQSYKKHKIMIMKNPIILSIKECFVVTLNSIKRILL